MKRGMLVGIVLIALVIVVSFFYIGNSTGNVALTPGANYGPVSDSFSNDVNCVYVGEDDGWDVLKIGTVRYLNRATGNTEEISDTCYDEVVREYHCVDGYLRNRLVNCPNGYYCDDGYCRVVFNP